MKKQLMLLMLFACSLVAKAQFANPYEYNNGNGLTVKVSPYLVIPSENGAPQNVLIYRDTIANANTFGIGVFGIFDASKYKGKEDEINYTINAQVKDHYNRNMDSSKVFELKMSFLTEYFGAEEKNQALEDASTEIGGHFYWSWKDSIANKGMSGHIQLNVDPQNFVYGKSGSEEIVKEHSQFDIRSRIKTGFPYDIAKYQGVTKYSVYDPDSTLICTKEIPLRMSADSLMNGQIQEDLICTVDSACKGSYKVVMEAPFLEKPAMWRVEVIDPLANASSQNPADATYRLKEKDFKNEGKGKGWNCNGNINPEYVNEVIGNSNYSAMVVRTKGYEGNGFSLTQKIDEMPQGYYKLSWPVIYQPCAIEKIQGNEPILAEIEANGFGEKAKHILACIGTIESVQKDSVDGFVSIVLPQSNKAFAYVQTMNAYKSEVMFQVKEDSVINIGIHKNHATLDDEVTAIGTPTLTYYGAGLPYGVVSFKNDSIYAAGDSLKIQVDLYDGVGKKVPEDNTIDMVFCKKLANGNFDTQNPVFSKQLKAPKKDCYDMSIKLPEGAEQLADGSYLLLIASLKDEKGYLLFEQKIFEIGNASAINEVMAEPAANTAKGNADKNIYNLAGMKVANSQQANGIIIQNGKKFAK